MLRQARGVRLLEVPSANLPLLKLRAEDRRYFLWVFLDDYSPLLLFLERLFFALALRRRWLLLLQQVQLVVQRIVV